MITYQPHPAIGALTTPVPAQRPVLDRMVDKVLEMGMNGVSVTKESLFENSDFTRAEIESHAAEACDMARSRAVRRVA
ncbi:MULTISPECIES: hypothetical protein [unclassified Mesorhizobium]|uniref:hypothetical protein n=1 Tax=unclassified Mesorhizobium TaxID=325217 RepID=UPI0009690276|nr:MULTISPECIES: hypothetical protein [unclassified Mesorhizobium]MBN9255236.1 hypothetical protein [Mesorhizobium sp.]OJX74170.1 MAG: hypothetical protein BGO93_16550 [Mesorhizobium sp. 65-26]